MTAGNASATPGGSLTPLQCRLIALLADVAPAWVPTGGVALVGLYAAHRSTLDPDLRWPGQSDLVDVSHAIEARLRAASPAFEVLQSAPAFRRLRVIDSGEVAVIDLVDKLCALLGRAASRDLEEVRALLGVGGDLDRAVSDAPRKDGGFSLLMLAWVLRGLPTSRLAEAAGWAPDAAAALEGFRNGLVDAETLPQSV